jgi:hypothetical protein
MTIETALLDVDVFDNGVPPASLDRTAIKGACVRPRPRPRMARRGGSTISRRAPERVAPRRQHLPNGKRYTDARLKSEH